MVLFHLKTLTNTVSFQMQSDLHSAAHMCAHLIGLNPASVNQRQALSDFVWELISHVDIECILPKLSPRDGNAFLVPIVSAGGSFTSLNSSEEATKC